MIQEFKKFINKGNVVEMAVGLILATYFGAIVKSLVTDILMPPLGKLLGGIDFSKLKIVIQEGVDESSPAAGDSVAEVAVRYGLFLNTLITFVIVAFAIFLVVKFYNKLRDNIKKEETVVEQPAPSKEQLLLEEIRDLLKEKK